MWPDPTGVLRSLISFFRQRKLQSQRTTCLVMGGYNAITIGLTVPHSWDVNDHRKLAEEVRKNVLDYRLRLLSAGDSGIAYDS